MGNNRFRRSFWLILSSMPLLGFLLIPLIAVALRVPIEALASTFAKPAVREALSLSLLTTSSSMLITLVFGTPIAILLARPRFRGQALLDTLIDLPMILPPSVAGIALLMAFGRRGLLGQYLRLIEIELPFTTAAVVLAQVFVASPFYIKAAAAAFATIDHDLEDAAALDGANSRQIFWFISIPLAWTGVVSGAVMTWVRALGEFGATIIFAGNFVGRTQTMPLAIYQGFEQDLNVALILAMLLLVISFMILGLVKGLLAQRLR
ncbi:MAG TPA: molybdate ABC transporter permease subunit [Herpetosiphon sp.]|uniref:Molybdenum transport system permease n=2 Tax=Herpetosiphon TaxID=64 RepID=A9B2T7_HERA2|nr:molybdate ABC transporter, inner membrane subunit [Herpetosiphon aurantiacus DSM 785]HBW52084.1 molybdate ABC transporter permease subunit [Herpetosiphon sp.]